jgi:cystathionine beta-synthase
MPEKMSMEKELTLRTLGAEIVRTPTTAPSQSEFSNLGVAKRLAAEIPGGVILDQYGNPNNPLAHELTTGPEIIQAIEASKNHPTRPTSGKVDLFVAGAGTGGTLTGTSKALKETHNKDILVVGVDPKGSILAQPASLNQLDPSEEDQIYQVEGIGYDFVPEALNHKFVDQWVKTGDQDAWNATSDLHRLEGLLVGGSSGSILSGALQFLKSKDGWERFGNVEGQNVVIVLPDGLRNYMSKPWFKKIVEDRPKSELSSTIAQVLAKKPA